MDKDNNNPVSCRCQDAYECPCDLLPCVCGILGCHNLSSGCVTCQHCRPDVPEHYCASALWHTEEGMCCDCLQALCYRYPDGFCPDCGGDFIGNNEVYTDKLCVKCEHFMCFRQTYHTLNNGDILCTHCCIEKIGIIEGTITRSNDVRVLRVTYESTTVDTPMIGLGTLSELFSQLVTLST